MQVTYEGNVKVEQGNELTPTQVKNQPHVHYIADPKSFYVLCMTGDYIVEICVVFCVFFLKFLLLIPYTYFL